MTVPAEPKQRRPPYAIWSLGAGTIALVAAIALYLLFVGFRPTPGLELVGTPPIRYPPFQTWPTPRTFDGPGTLFTLEDGAFTYLDGLKIESEVAGTENFPNLNGSANWGGSLLAQYMGIAKANVNSSSDLLVRVELGEGRRTRVSGSKLESALVEWVKQKPTRTLYVVTESISVTRILYTVETKNDLNGMAEGDTKITEGNVKAKRNLAGSWLFDATYDQPHYLFYRAKKVEALLGLNEPRVSISDPTADLQWKTERRP